MAPTRDAALAGAARGTVAGAPNAQQAGRASRTDIDDGRQGRTIRRPSRKTFKEDHQEPTSRTEIGDAGRYGTGIGARASEHGQRSTGIGTQARAPRGTGASPKASQGRPIRGAAGEPVKVR